MPFIIIGILLGIPLGVGVYFLVKRMRERNLMAAFSMVLLLVKIPREHAKESAERGDVKQEIGTFEQLLANLASLKKPFVFEAAVPHVGEEIHFYVAVSRIAKETTAKQIQGLWNGASVTEATGDYTIFNAEGASVGAYLKLKQNYALPLRTYVAINADTFSSVIGAFTKVSDVGEGAALQLIVRPASTAQSKIRGHLKLLRSGEPTEKVLGNKFVGIDLTTLTDALNPSSREKEKPDKIVDEDTVKALEEKVAKPLFNVNARIFASAPSPFQANDILDGLAAGFSQLTSPRRNEIVVVKPRQSRSLIRSYIYRSFTASHTMVLNSEEIASIFHFPTSHTETPKVKWLKSKEAAAPSNLPADGVNIGESSFRGERKKVRVTDEDRRRHVYLIGQTGTGKSTLLANMAIEDIERGKGIALIDPHGDLIDTILRHIPARRLDDIVHFDPSDLWRPLGLNMLEYNFDRPEEKTFIVNEMQSIFNKLFVAETMGPMFEQYMRNILLLLMEDMPNEPATLMEVPRVMTDAEYRRRKTSRITNPAVIDFWEKEASKVGGEASIANMTPYITSKFSNFISNDYMRPIIGQTRSAFNFREVMDSGKILLINLSKGRIGDINAGLLGMVFTGKILMAALSRVDAPEAARKDFYLYIDEFQNFTTDSIATILSEARKYRLNLTMAHQFIAQLTEKIRDAVFGNVGSEVVFRVGVQDAEFLLKQFEPTFSRNDLISIDNMNAYAKILISGETSRPFNVKIDTRSWEPGNKENADKYREYSRLKYGADRKEIEAAILARLRS